MNRKKLLLLFIFIFVTCCGCSGKYTLTYKEDNFSEEFVLVDFSDVEEEILARYTDGSEYLEIDENNSYSYEEKDNKKYYKYNMGKEFVLTPLIEHCFDKVFVVDEDNYINIKTSGENECDASIELYFDTDKKVVSSNASSVKDNVYKWDSLDDGVEIHFSKTEKAELDGKDITKERNDFLIRLGISVLFIGLVIGIIIFLKKRFED